MARTEISARARQEIRKRVMDQVKRQFRPEFLNRLVDTLACACWCAMVVDSRAVHRLDEYIIFNSLNRDSIKLIVQQSVMHPSWQPLVFSQPRCSEARMPFPF
eukprot:3638245-Rhodomonas_salina.2